MGSPTSSNPDPKSKLNRATVLKMLLDHKDQIHHCLEVAGMSSAELIDK